jgi:DNA-binding response OmpR family regulator
MARVLLGTDPGPPLTRGLLRIYLESAGHQVQELGDGEAVLVEAATGAPPDVLVLDTALPSLDGFQVLARLHAQAATPRVPILVISTIPAQLGQRLVESMGAAVYLHKPFTYEALRLALEDVLAPDDHTANGAAPLSGHVAAAEAASPSGDGGDSAALPAQDDAATEKPPRPLRGPTKPPRGPARERPAG